MSPLLTVLIAFLIGFIEWYIALRRTLALTRGEEALKFILVLVEGLLAWGVLSSFLAVPSYDYSLVPFDTIAMCISNLWTLVQAYRWKILIAVSASIGGAVGSLLVHPSEDEVESGKPMRSKPARLLGKLNLRMGK